MKAQRMPGNASRKAHMWRLRVVSPTGKYSGFNMQVVYLCDEKQTEITETPALQVHGDNLRAGLEGFQCPIISDGSDQ